MYGLGTEIPCTASVRLVSLTRTHATQISWVQNIYYRTSTTEHLLQNIYCRTSTTEHLLQNIYCRTSTAEHLLQNIYYRTSTTEHLLQNIYYRTSTTEHLLQHCQLHDALRRDMWPEQRRHHDCRTSTTALPTTRCSEPGHVARTKTTEGQALCNMTLTRDKRSMCCTWFAHDCARATWAYALETVRGAVRRL